MSTKIVFTVNYRDEKSIKDAINALNAIGGVSAENDKNNKNLLRDVTVTVTEGTDTQIPGKILKAFGSVHEKLRFKVTFKDIKHQEKALKVVNELKGVVKTEFEHVDSWSNAPLTLNVAGEVDGRRVDRDLVHNILLEHAALAAWAL